MDEQRIIWEYDDLSPMESLLGEHSEEERIEMSFNELCALLTECVYMNPERPSEPMRIDRPNVVKALLKGLHIKTSVKADRKKGILIYYNGRYIPDGDLHIEKILANAFLELTTPNKKSLYSTSEKNQILDRIKELTPTLDNQFDADLNIINMQNGLYNWQTGKFHEHTPDYPSRIQIPVNYDPEAKCPTIEEFFRIVLKPEDIPKMIEFIAYCLYREYPIQKIFIALGPGGTGKSFLAGIIVSFVGKENKFSISPHELTKDRFAGADLYLKLLNIIPDVGDEKLAQTALIKALTGRDDSVRAQKKYGDAFEFINFAKLFFGFNKLPETGDKTSGWYRRVEIIKMEHVLGETELSREFIDRLTSPEELSGLFNLAIRTLPDLLKRNAFTNETSREDMAEQYETISNPMKYFCEHFLMNIPQERITKDELYDKYWQFCKIAGVAVPKKINEGSAKNNLGRYIHENVDWLKNRPPKDEVGRVGTGKDSKPTSIWLDTKFDTDGFNKWISITSITNR